MLKCQWRCSHISMHISCWCICQGRDSDRRLESRLVGHLACVLIIRPGGRRDVRVYASNLEDATTPTAAAVRRGSVHKQAAWLNEEGLVVGECFGGASEELLVNLCLDAPEGELARSRPALLLRSDSEENLS